MNLLIYSLYLLFNQLENLKIVHNIRDPWRIDR